MMWIICFGFGCEPSWKPMGDIVLDSVLLVGGVCCRCSTSQRGAGVTKPMWELKLTSGRNRFIWQDIKNDGICFGRMFLVPRAEFLYTLCDFGAVPDPDMRWLLETWWNVCSSIQNSGLRSCSDTRSQTFGVKLLWLSEPKSHSVTAASTFCQQHMTKKSQLEVHSLAFPGKDTVFPRHCRQMQLTKNDECVFKGSVLPNYKVLEYFFLHI